MSKSKKAFILLFILGLAIRIALVAAPAGNDVMSYAKWGHNVVTTGLAGSFDGVYFPLQYLVFAKADIFSSVTGLPFADIIKIFNLGFEIALFGLIVLLTKDRLEPWKMSLLYWLNPLSLVIFSQGYIDAHFSFFILAAVWFISKSQSRHKYWWASACLGIGLLMKPQAIPIFISLVILAVVLACFKKAERKKIATLFVIPIVLIIGFSAYFGFALNIGEHKTLSIIATKFEHAGLSKGLSEFAGNSTFLAAHYIHVPDVMPAINANMPSPWFLVAQSLRQPDQPIYRVSDKLSFAHINFRMLGLALFIVLMIITAYRLAKSGRRFEDSAAWMILVTPFIVPYIATSAHENHFFLGFIGALIIAAWLMNRKIWLSVYALGFLNGLNLFSLYVLPKMSGIQYALPVQVTLTAISCVIFIATLYWLERELRGGQIEIRPETLPYAI